MKKTMIGPRQQTRPDEQPEQQQHPHGDAADGIARTASEHRMGDVAAVELADGQQIESSHHQAEPASESQRTELEHMAFEQRGTERELREKGEQHRRADGSATVHHTHRRITRIRDDDRRAQTDKKRGNRDDQSGQRPGNSDIEKRAPILRGRTHLDERAERAQRERHRNEKRQRHADAMMPGHEIMAQLVGAENRQQPKGVGQADAEASRLAKQVDAFDAPPPPTSS